jgi:Domain of unknown function (DUF1707)
VTSTPSDGLPRPASDDRDTAVQRIRDAYADGDLSYEELDRRLHSALTARSREELSASLESLPAKADGGLLRIVGTSGKIRRIGEWRVPRVLQIESEYGAVELDLSQALIETSVVDIELQLRFGGAKITLPLDAVVDLNELRSVWKQPAYEPPPAARSRGPLIRISGTMEYGRLKIRHKRP